MHCVLPDSPIYAETVFHHEPANLLYLIVNVCRQSHFAVVQVYKIHERPLRQKEFRDEQVCIAENTSYIPLVGR